MATRSAPEVGAPVDARPPLQRSTASSGYEVPPSPTRQRRERRRTGRGVLALLTAFIGRVLLFGQDVIWRVRGDRRLLLGASLAAFGVVLLYLVINLTQARIFPNMWALGVPLGGQSIDEAAQTLQTAWDNTVQIQLVDGERTWTVLPRDLGIRLDARQTAEAARAAGLSGVPFGNSVLPTVELDMLTAQTLLLNLSRQTDIVPLNAGYRWENDQLVGVPGSDGRYLDVAMTLENLRQTLPQVADQRTLALDMTPASPDILDPQPYLAQVQALTGQTFLIRGYDPFTDETLVWMPDRETFTGWLEAGADSLSLREAPFAAYLDLQTASLDSDNGVRYLEAQDAIEQVRTAIEEGKHEAYLRVHYRNQVHTVESGDSGYRIARRNGVSFYLLQQANPNRNWDDMLTVGEQIVVPSRDSMLPLPPVPNKRIVVDLETQQLWAYENGQLVFNWLISSGMSQAPTSPGIYQVLSHEEEAEGSSIELCGDTSCGTWTMYWFMGIYEAVPGLVNGFHGAVLLPGGRYMGGGNVGTPYTYGCVMSQNDNAEQLYNWADEGTIVEIVSSEFPPQSALARQSLAMLQGAGQPA